uniref:Lipocalin/cytosolic fatty-acid binding domain-containing protein n=1 Tax=Strigamia maritima TaxID=126957 RepID=T1J314_STRMM
MVLPVTALSLLLLIYGQDDLPPPKASRGHKCPSAKPQPGFDMTKLLKGSFYYNYGYANKDTLNRFKCIKFRFEKQADGVYLHISGLKKNNIREQSWHKLRHTNERPGHYEIDFRSANHSHHESDAYFYVKRDRTMTSIVILVCTRFPIADKHAVNAIVGSNKDKLSKKILTSLLTWAQEQSQVDIDKDGLSLTNKCQLPNKSPIGNPHHHSHHDHPHSHSHSHSHSHPKPQGSHPQGSHPQGSIPQGSIPQGSIPQGSIPQGSHPQGSQPVKDYSESGQQEPDGPCRAELIAFYFHNPSINKELIELLLMNVQKTAHPNDY